MRARLDPGPASREPPPPPREGALGSGRRSCGNSMPSHAGPRPPGARTSSTKSPAGQPGWARCRACRASAASYRQPADALCSRGLYELCSSVVASSHHSSPPSRRASELRVRSPAAPIGAARTAALVRWILSRIVVAPSRRLGTRHRGERVVPLVGRVLPESGIGLPLVGLAARRDPGQIPIFRGWPMRSGWASRYPRRTIPRTCAPR